MELSQQSLLDDTIEWREVECQVCHNVMIHPKQAEWYCPWCGYDQE